VTMGYVFSSSVKRMSPAKKLLFFVASVRMTSTKTRSR
jgi:hypothetical protein